VEICKDQLVKKYSTVKTHREKNPPKQYYSMERQKAKVILILLG
jgi:hypothetical protein